VEKDGLEGCNPCATPMEPRLKLSKESSAPLVDCTLYKSLIGSLRYLENIRSDIAYVVGYVSRFMNKPTQEHFRVVKRIIRYIGRTMNYGCQYGNKEEWWLFDYSDSDLAGDVDTRKSTLGLIYFLFLAVSKTESSSLVLL
jgi:hypothetical protein